MTATKAAKTWAQIRMHATKEGRVKIELRDILQNTGCNYYDTKDRLIAFFNRIAREYKHDTKIVEVESKNSRTK